VTRQDEAFSAAEEGSWDAAEVSAVGCSDTVGEGSGGGSGKSQRTPQRWVWPCTCFFSLFEPSMAAACGGASDRGYILGDPCNPRSPRCHPASENPCSPRTGRLSGAASAPARELQVTSSLTLPCWVGRGASLCPVQCTVRCQSRGTSAGSSPWSLVSVL